MKFLQLYPFYDQFLSSCYRSDTSLRCCEYDEQLMRILQYGFGAHHLLVPQLDKYGYETEIVIPNCFTLQMQWAEEHGIDITDDDIQDKRWVYDIAKQQIEYFKPDILLIQQPVVFDSSFIRTLKWEPLLIMGSHGSDIPSTTDWSSFDMILSGLTRLREQALKLGAKSVREFMPGFPLWIMSHLDGIKKEKDVVFLGNWTEFQHEKRNRYIEYIVQYIKSNNYPFSCSLYMGGDIATIPSNVSESNYGNRFGIDMYKTMCAGKIVFDGRGSIRLLDGENTYDLACNETANIRIFEAAGSGAFLLTEYHDNLNNYFKVGEEIETYANKDELIKKIHFYLDHPDERDTIAQQGQKRCHKDHSMKERARQFDVYVKEYMKQGKKTLVTSSN
ncbi:glycosyltransferase [Candidatus Omnitrophota bacterium]